MNIRKELAKGSTGLLVLSILSKKDMYGYQIIKEIELTSERVFQLNEGTLYPILHALEEEKCLEHYWDEGSGRRRKYYRITSKGKKALAAQKEEWRSYSSAVEKVIGGANYAGA